MGNILSFIFFNYLSYVKQLNYSNNISVWLIGKNRLLTLKQKQQHYEILHVASSWSWRFQLLCRLPQVPCWYHLLTLHRASNNLTRLGSDDIPRTAGRHQTRRRLMMKFLYFVYTMRIRHVNGRWVCHVLGQSSSTVLHRSAPAT